jgi:hypothetical protein
MQTYRKPLCARQKWLRYKQFLSAGILPESLKCHPDELGLYSEAVNKPLKGFQGRGIRSEMGVVNMINICLL